MEQITIGQIGVALTFIVGLLSGITYMRRHIREWIAGSLQEQFDGLNASIKGLERRIEETDMDSTKNFLVECLADAEKGDVWDEVEKERFWEEFDKYTKHGGNSYIRNKAEKLKQEGKI